MYVNTIEFVIQESVTKTTNRFDIWKAIIALFTIQIATKLIHKHRMLFANLLS